MEAFEAPPAEDSQYAVYATGQNAAVYTSLAAARDYVDEQGGDGYRLFKMVEM